MREPIRDKERLEHICSAIEIIMNRKDAYNLEQLQSDPIIYYGFVKQVEIIGEAVYKLSAPFKESHPEIEWDAI